MKRKSIALILSFVMVLGLLAGCGGSKSAQTTTTAASTTQSQKTGDTSETTAAAAKDAETEPAAAEEPGEPITITLGVSSLGNGWPDKVEDDFVHTGVLEATNVDVQFIRIDEYYTSLNVQLSGGTAPDFFTADFDHLKTYADQGLIRNINDYRDDLAPTFEYLGEEGDSFTMYADGDLYAFPFSGANGSKYFGIYARQDFLDALGMSAPTTVDELFDYCTAAVQQDASGLGNTIGLGGSGWSALDLIASTYGVHLDNYVIIKDGKVDNTLLDPHMEDALTAVKRFFDAGLVDADLFGKAHADNMNNGYVAIGVEKWVNILKKARQETLHQMNPDASWALVNPLKSNIGEGSEPFIMIDYNSNATSKYVVNESTSDEKIAAFIKVLNYLSSEEGQLLSWFGVQGVHWDYDADGAPEVLEGQDSAINYVSTWQLPGRNDEVYLAMKFPYLADEIAYSMNMPRGTKYNDMLDVPDTLYVSDMESYVSDQLLQFVKGDRPISEYRDFVQELYDVYDLQAYMDLAEEQLKAQGLVN